MPKQVCKYVSILLLYLKKPDAENHEKPEVLRDE
jgi:hypothetical protein